MTRTVMTIEGMMCGMCENHICDVIRKTVPGARKVRASRKRKEATFLSDEPVDAGLLKNAVNATGYTCLGVISEEYEKKGLFSGKS